MEVLHEGYLEKCLNPDENKREWRKRYFVLKKATGSGTQTLEYYKEKEWKKQEPKGVLTLFSGYTAEKVNDPKKKHTFEVKTIDNFFILSAPTEELRDKWLEALMQQSAGKIFNVTLEESAKTKELGVVNERCILQITSSSVLLVLGSSPAISWPFNCIRRYKCHPGIFLLEVGRKAPTGEGEFRFITQEGQDIFEILAKAVANRISVKRGNDYQTDFITGFAASAVPNREGNIASQAQNAPKSNLFLDPTGQAENVRFVMKKRSTSSPPPSPPRELASSPPTHVDVRADDYSHLKFQVDRLRSCSNEEDYDQLARAKECNRFNKTRMSDSRHPSVSSNKALKVLGLLRSNSVDSLPRAPIESTGSEASDSYAHLEFGQQKVKKSQSSDVLMDELKGAALNFKSRPEITDKNSDDVFQADNVYNKLHSERPKNASVSADNNTCNEVCNVEDTYDRLGPNQHAHHHKTRPEPIIITDDAYDALSFGMDKAKLDSKAPAVSNAYEEAASFRPVKSSNGSSPNLTEASKADAGKRNIPPRVSATKPAPPLASKPLVARKPASVKPAPAKPPRKIGPPANAEFVGAKSSPDPPNKVPASPVETRAFRDKIGNGAKNNLVAQLKKNLEGQGFSPKTKSPSPPKSPPVAARKAVEPFYAVSPFAGGNTPQAVQSEYDVPSNAMPAVEHKPIDFMYAVSPFHSGNKNDAKPLEENLYDSPAQQVRCDGEQNLYDTPMPNLNNNKAENLYDSPVVQQSEYDVVKNVRPAYPNAGSEYANAGPAYSNAGSAYSNAGSAYPNAGSAYPNAGSAYPNAGAAYPNAGAANPSEVSKAPVQFMYAVSPFAAGHSQRSESGLELERGESYDEAGYCEVGNLITGGGPPAGYAQVGETFNPNESDTESIYSVPRDERR